MRASELRRKARQALKGKWGTAVAAYVVAVLLLNAVSLLFSGNTGGAVMEGYLSFENIKAASSLMTVALLSALVSLLIGGAVQLGWCRFDLNLVCGRKAQVGDIFSQFGRLWEGFLMQLVMGLFIFLWTLLLIIPGIIAAYSYTMVPYLMAEFPELSVMDAIRESKRLMRGNKWRLFCLNLSFIGWWLLSALTFGVGNLWLTPYMRTTAAAFYMEVTGRGEPLTQKTE